MSTTNKEFNARNGALIGTSSANYLQLLGGSAGNSVAINAIGSDTNISIALTPKGSGTVNIPSGANLSITNGTANGVLYLDSNKIVTSGSALTFDGSKLSVYPSNNSGFGLLDSSNATRGLFFVNNSSFNTGLRTNNYWLDLDASGPAQNAIRFFTGNGAIGSGTERLRIDSSGVITTPEMVINTKIKVDEEYTYFSQQRYVESGRTGLNKTTATEPTFTTTTDTTVPFSKTLNFSGYYDGYVSEYIPIQAGDILYVECWAYRANGATGTAGGLYVGLETYDKDKLVSSANAGLSYQISNVTVPTTGVWTKYSGYYTAPLTHTPYNGSDGGPIRYVRPRILVNYSAGTIATQIAGLIVRRKALARDSGDFYLNGNFGIGSINPGSRLDVNGDTFLRGNLGVYSSTGGAVNSNLLNFGSAALIQAAAIYSKTDTATAGNLILATAQSGTGTMTERMRIDSSGNVGIGTSSPAEKLDVNGAIAIGGKKFLSKISGNSYWWNNTSATYWVDSAGNTVQMALDASGNLGLGVTPSAWSSTYMKAVQLGNKGSSIAGSTSSLSTVPYTSIVNNAYYASDANWKYYDGTYSVALYQQASNEHRWSIASTGTTGATITWTQAMTLDASGNLGIGVTPSAWASTARAFTIGSTGSGIVGSIANSGATNAVSLISNAYYNAGWKYIYSGGSYSAGRYDIEGNTHSWYIAPTGTTGSAISFTQAMTLDASGNLGIGTTSANAKLAFGNASDIAFNTGLGSTGTYASIKCFNTLVPSTPATNIRFIRDVAVIGNDGAICFDTTGTERMRIDSSGNVGIGTGGPSNKLEVITYSGDAIKSTATTGLPLILNNGAVNSNPTLMEFEQQGYSYWRMGVPNASDAFAIYGYGGGAFPERLRIDSSGNVGIGTSSPSLKLNVVGADAARFENTSNGAVNVYWKNSTQQYSYRLDPNNNGSRDFSIYDDTNSQFVDKYFQGASGYRAFYTNGTERMRLDSSGNLGLGVTPSAFSNSGNLQLGANKEITSTGNGLNLFSNHYYNAGDKFAGTGYAMSYQMYNGIHTWYTSTASGTAGNAISFTQAMTLDASGNLGIGVTSISQKLQVNGKAIIGSYANTGAYGLYLRSDTESTHYNWQISTQNTVNGGFEIARSDAVGSGTFNSPSMVINSSGNVGIGTSSPAAKLHVVSGSFEPFRFGATTSGYNYITHLNYSAGVVGYIGDGLSAVTGYAATDYAIRANQGNLLFATNGNNVRAIIDSSGNVGIGTSSPANGLLNIGTDGSSKGIAVNAGSQATYGYLSVSHYTNGAFISTYAGSNTASDILRFGTTGTEKARITSGGNVLIGTTTDGGYKLQVNGSFAATTKSFLIDHPTKEGMKLRYGSLESPYHGVRLTGEGVLINGSATIELPEYIKGLCKQEGSQVQITNIKHGKVIWVEDIEVDNNRFTVAAEVNDNKEYKFYWSFTAIRKDIDDMIVEF